MAIGKLKLQITPTYFNREGSLYIMSTKEFMALGSRYTSTGTLGFVICTEINFPSTNSIPDWL